MTASNVTAVCDIEVATHQYETLRSNALGHINRASDFTLFLSYGMSVWLREIAQRDVVQKEIYQEAPSTFTESGVSMADLGLVSILTDAILNIAWADRHYEGDK